MSRALLAALAAAAAVCAAPRAPARTYPPLTNVMDCSYDGYCHTDAKGFITMSSLQLPELEVPPAVAKYSFFIPDKCKEWGRELAGSVVHACDDDVTPTLTLFTETGAGSASLRRHGTLRTPSYVYMKQYCV